MCSVTMTSARARSFTYVCVCVVLWEGEKSQPKEELTLRNQLIDVLDIG